MRALILPLLGLLPLAACAPGQCDPGSAGFFGGIGCSGGAYAQRTQSLQGSLAYQQQQSMAASQENALAQRDAANAQAQEASLRRRVGEMQRGQADLRRQLAAAQARRGASDAALQRATTDLNSLDNQLRATPSTPDAAAVNRLQQQRQAILAEIGAL